MEFRVLGALSVRDGEREVSIPGAKPKALLALLLLRPGEAITADRLIDELWGEAPPAGAPNALQSQVSKVRKALGADGAALVTDAHGYRLDIDRETIDATRFADAVERGQQALGEGDALAAAETLNEALALWRGSAFDGLADDGVLRREAIRLEELRLGAIEDRCDANLRLGRHVELVPELGALVDEHPLRERLHGFLMLALYRSGRQGEALRAYQDARAVLGEELGLEPGVELQALEAEILNQDPSLSLARPARAATPTRRAPTLMGGLSRFIGRADELKALGDLVAEHRLTTVVGPGGAGKTRLSVEVATRRQEDERTWLVELAPLGDSEGVADAIALAIGIADGALLVDGVAATPVERLAQHLGDTEALIVLDNCEHVVAEAARVTELLLLSCPGLRILATSREALGIGGETIWPVPAMAIEDAMALFVDRAEGSSGFALSEETESSVNDVCTRLDGLPLAIELAAGRVRAIPVGQLASRLDDRFRILTGGARTALPRQQTLRAVVEWSYDLLFDEEQRVFERLSVFSGGCTLESAEAVCSGDDLAPEDVADLLSHLVDKSLVVADHTSGVSRFHLLQTLALYGRERLAASGEAERVRDRHVAHYLELCARGPDAFRGDVDQIAWLADVNREADNIRTALAWTMDQGDAQRTVEMLGGVGWSWWFSGRGEEGWRLLVSGLSVPGPVTPGVRARAAMWAGYVGAAANTGMQAALAWSEESVALWRESGDAQGLADGTMLLGGVHLSVGNRERAAELFDEAHERFSAYSDDFSIAVATYAKGRAAGIRGDLATAEALMATSVVHFVAAGAEWARALSNDDVAVIAELRGDIDGAIAGTEKACEAAVELDLRGIQSLLLGRLGNYALIQGDFERAEQYHAEALALAEEFGFRTSIGFTLNGRAMLRRAEGRLDEAAEAAQAAASVFRTSGMSGGITLSCASLGFIAERQGDLAEARTQHSKGLDVAITMGDTCAIALACEGLAGVATAEQDGAAAAALLGCADALRTSAGGTPAGPASDVERVTAAAVALVGEEAFADEYARGQTSAYEDLL